jgi:hypothetical protein
LCGCISVSKTARTSSNVLHISYEKNKKNVPLNRTGKKMCSHEMTPFYIATRLILKKKKAELQNSPP